MLIPRQTMIGGSLSIETLYLYTPSRNCTLSPVHINHKLYPLSCTHHPQNCTLCPVHTTQNLYSLSCTHHPETLPSVLYTPPRNCNLCPVHTSRSCAHFPETVHTTRRRLYTPTRNCAHFPDTLYHPETVHTTQKLYTPPKNCIHKTQKL